MADLITAAELDRKIKELQEARKKMVAKTARVCPKCLLLYDISKEGNRAQCYCDYESDDFDRN